ncbi:hypothetical protein B0H13DRAFT_1656333 [Mycena leptocephala]|nr:hypothetical protein B0H13DRAFT_1656333 [Mycena leptocephala]
MINTNPAARRTTRIQGKGNKPVKKSAKIIVSNLPPDLTNEQVKELFHPTVGPVHDVTLSVRALRGSVVATVTFVNEGDGDRAFRRYNNRLIDGKRPLKIETKTDPVLSTTNPEWAATTPQTAGNGSAAAIARSKNSTNLRRWRRSEDDRTFPELDAELSTPQAAGNRSGAIAELDAELNKYMKSRPKYPWILK